MTAQEASKSSNIQKNPNFFYHPWCFGSLETAAVSIGVTNIVTVIVIFLWIIQILIHIDYFFIAIILSSIVSFVFLVVNLCLLFGASRRNRHLVIPWLTVYIFYILALIIGCAVQFHNLNQFKPIAIMACALMIYFYYVVIVFYHQLLSDNQNNELRDEEEKIGGTEKLEYLIPMEEKSDGPVRAGEDSDAADETFTDLASSRSQGQSKNPFRNKKSLPKPDEVIHVDEFMANTSSKEDESEFLKEIVQDNTITKDFFASNKNYDESTPIIDSKQVISIVSKKSPQTYQNCETNHPLAFVDDPTSNGESNAHKISQDTTDNGFHPPSNNLWQSHLGLCTEGEVISVNSTTVDDDKTSDYGFNPSQSNGRRPLGQTRSSKAWHSHSALLADIDTTFSPFKQKNKTDMPKMKIFLPKSSGDISSSNDEDDSSNDEEETHIKPIQN